MTRRVLVLFALLAAFVQAVAAFPGSAGDPIAHLFVHAQESNHHHHDDDGLVDAGPGAEANFHVHPGDGASLALTDGSALKPAVPTPSNPPRLTRLSLPEPFLDGLLRPPRAPA